VSTNFQFNTAKLKAAFTQNLQDVIAQETGLAKVQLTSLIEFSATIFPMIVQQTQEMVNSSDPQVQQQYIEGLVAAEIDKAAQLLGEQILAQRALVVQEIKTWTLNFADALLTASGNPLIAILAGAIITTVQGQTG